MTEKKATAILVIITLFWSASFLFMKLGLNSFEPFNIIALRFGIAFLLLLPIVIKARKEITKKIILHSTVLGVLLFLVFTLLLIALKSSTTTNIGFLQALSICFVPLFESLILKKVPDKRITIGVILSTLGLGFLTIKSNLSINPGDILCIISAVIYTLHIIYTDRVVKTENPLIIGVLQLGVVGILGFISSSFFETFTLPSTTMDWGIILALSVFCSALGFVGQSVAQKYASSIKTGIIFAFEPLFAAFLGIVFLHEVMSVIAVFGAVLMFAGIIFANKALKEKEICYD